MTPMGADKRAEYYGPGDLRLGASIDIHGRTFWLFDCDAFTRQYCLVRDLTQSPSTCAALAFRHSLFAYYRQACTYTAIFSFLSPHISLSPTCSSARKQNLRDRVAPRNGAAPGGGGWGGRAPVPARDCALYLCRQFTRHSPHPKFSQ